MALSSTQECSLSSRPTLVTNDSSEIHFISKHPKNTSILAIYITTLVMYILFRLPRRGAAVLLAGMRSILMSQASLLSLASEVPKDPRRLLTLYNLDPVTHYHVCCPACSYLYPYSVRTTKKRKASALSSGFLNHAENANEDIPLVSSTPTHCTHRRLVQVTFDANLYLQYLCPRNHSQ